MDDVLHLPAQDVLVVERRRPRGAGAVRGELVPASRPRRRIVTVADALGPARAAAGRRDGRRTRGGMIRANRRRHDLPGLSGPARAVAARRARARGPARPQRPRPARLDTRPPPHGRRHPVRRRSRHGDAPRAVGRGARRACSPATATRRAGRSRRRAGVPFSQRVAERLAGGPRLVFAAGRYEGIDQRVVDHYRAAGGGRGDQRRRLRAQRRRGRGHGDDRGRSPG